MSTTALVGTNSYPSFPRLPRVGCDLPEDGGIGGNMRNEDKPIPGALEERPTIIDPKTGEKIYLDKFIEQFLNPDKMPKVGGRFSTTA